MGRPKIVNRRNLRLAIEGSYGNQRIIAEKLHCTYQTIYSAFKEFPDMKALLEEERSKLLDTAEWVIAEAVVKKKDVNTAKWVLENLGVKRGYNPEVEAMKDNQVKVIFTDKLDEDDCK